MSCIDRYVLINFDDDSRDAFSKREQADENLYVRQKEQEKLLELKKKISDHKKHLDELDQHVYVSYMRTVRGSGVLKVCAGQSR